MSTNQAPLKFHDCDLLFRLSIELRKHLDRGLDDELSLDFNEVKILLHVATNEGEGRLTSVPGMTEELGIPEGIMKRLVGKLTADKLLQVDDSSNWPDRRRKELRISSTGADKLERLWQTWDHLLGQTLQGLDVASVQRLSEAVRGLETAPDCMRRSFEADGS